MKVRLLYLLSSESSELDSCFFATAAGFAGVLTGDFGAGGLGTAFAFGGSSSDDDSSLDDSCFFCATAAFLETFWPEDLTGEVLIGTTEPSNCKWQSALPNILRHLPHTILRI
jgi:hypothetical protein